MGCGGHFKGRRGVNTKAHQTCYSLVNFSHTLRKNTWEHHQTFGFSKNSLTGGGHGKISFFRTLNSLWDPYMSWWVLNQLNRSPATFLWPRRLSQHILKISKIWPGGHKFDFFPYKSQTLRRSSLFLVLFLSISGSRNQKMTGSRWSDVREKFSGRRTRYPGQFWTLELREA